MLPPPHPTEESRPAVLKLCSMTIVPGAAQRLNADFHVHTFTRTMPFHKMEAYGINEVSSPSSGLLLLLFPLRLRRSLGTDDLVFRQRLPGQQC